MKSAFTLVELLVVISIISLLSSIVFASLQSARDNATRSTIVQELNNFRLEAEISRQTSGNYDSVCNGSSSAYQLWASAVSKIESDSSVSFCVSSLSPARRENGVDSPDTIITLNGSVADAWAANAQMGNGEWYCIDSSGFADFVGSNTLAASDAQC